ncbi:MAG: 3-phosphoshikimate 1-carboxyvinyltransferase [Planctomycetaceae bacterium]
MSVIEIHPVPRAIRGTVQPPGSKSLTNRALIVAALAEGTSRLTGLLDSVDTRVMIAGLKQMGVVIDHNPATGTAIVQGSAGKPPSHKADIWVENSGTTIRFLTAFCSLAEGEFQLDGNARMRERPIGDLAKALNALGGNVQCNTDSDCPPVKLHAAGLAGGTANVAGTISSQYLSGLLMAAPCARSPVTLNVIGELVSRPYIEMTLGVMNAFGVSVDSSDLQQFSIEPQTYRATNYHIEPDASAASYFFAAAAVTGGKVTVQGLSHNSLQGDIGFVDVLEQMGCTVDWQADAVTVQGGLLRGVDVDMNAISDTAQTLAAVAVFADGPTRITNIAHVRHKETDRIAAVATELRRMGIEVEEFPDGMTITPGSPKPAVIHTYDDHRMAMSFAIIGLRAQGIQIADPDCTSKTYPRFFNDLKQLCGTAE